MHNYFIADTKEKVSILADKLFSLSEKDVISLDTEFDRVRTYYPRLDLIQIAIADGNEVCCYLADPHRTDITQIIRAVCECKALCLLFSAREDLDIIAMQARKAGLLKLLPEHCLDLQLMQAFLNLGYSKGLQGTLKDVLSIEVEKDQTLSDWSLRPLTDDQLRYACNDVAYLSPLYRELLLKFKKDDIRKGWFMTEMELFRQSCLIEIQPDDAYLYVNGAGSLNDRELSILHSLCKNRLILAREENVALNRIITGSALCQICRLTNISEKALLEAGVKAPAVRRYGKKIINWYLEGRKGNFKLTKRPVDSVAITKEYKAPLKALKKLLVSAAQKNGICQELICTRSNCHDYFFSIENNATAKIMTSWYKECVGEIVHKDLFV